MRERYQIIDVIGRGGTATTYEVRDLTTQSHVALKVLSLNSATDWKIVDLFEREAKALANLNHPRIPRYIDYFYLVQELIPGKSLAQLLAEGWRFQEQDVKEIAQQILSILTYLHSLNPAVIHRDIKPHNIIQTEAGEIYLVDFGAVQDVYRNTMTRGGTFVGTIDYMPPEQLRGQAHFSSDLYSLGCTMLYLLSRKSPLEMPLNNLKLDFHSRINVSHGLANWLDIVLEPAIEDRFKSTEAALEQLCNCGLLDRAKLKITKPYTSKLVFHKSEERLVFSTPAKNKYDYLRICVYILVACIISLSIMSLYTPINQIEHNLADKLIIYGMFSLPVLFVVTMTILELSQIKLEINRDNLYLQRILLCFKQKLVFKTKNISHIKVNYARSRQGSIEAGNCIFWHGVYKHRFGYFLRKSEKVWIAREMIDFITQVNPRYRSAKKDII